MKRHSWLSRVGLVAVAITLLTAAVAVAEVTPTIVLKSSKTTITYGEAAPFSVKAMDGTMTAAFDGTVTVYASTESSVSGFAVYKSKASTGSAVGFAPKPAQNTYYYATYETSQGVVTTSTTEMIGVKAKLGSITYKVPKRAAGGTLRVSSMISVKSETSTPTVELQKAVVTLVSKGKGKAKTKVTTWVTVETKSPTSYGKKKGIYRPFSVSFATTGADKGSKFRAIVRYEDPTHVLASKTGKSVTLKK